MRIFYTLTCWIFTALLAFAQQPPEPPIPLLPLAPIAAHARHSHRTSRNFPCLPFRTPSAITIGMRGANRSNSAGCKTVRQKATREARAIWIAKSTTVPLMHSTA